MRYRRMLYNVTVRQGDNKVVFTFDTVDMAAIFATSCINHGEVEVLITKSRIKEEREEY